MQVNCAPACFSCDKVSFESRCAHMPPDDTKNIWTPGSLNAMMERIVADPQYQNQLQVLFRPANGTTDATIPDGPWVLVLDNFLTPAECDTLIQLGAAEGYELSKDVSSEMKFDGTFDGVTSEGRTSTNAWCWNACYEHKVTKQVTAKIERLLGIPERYYEHFQLLKYEEQQFYSTWNICGSVCYECAVRSRLFVLSVDTHHDYIEHDIERPQGVRILTVFLYLNDVAEGGGTNFPLLDTVRMLLFCLIPCCDLILSHVCSFARSIRRSNPSGAGSCCGRRC
jgi:prolyl 4-hydroxylase